MRLWRTSFNCLMWGLGVGLMISTIHGWWEAGIFVVGAVVSCIRISPVKSRLDIATQKLAEMSGTIYHSAMRISQEWVPLTDSESMAKAVILAEMKDSMAEAIWDAHAREGIVSK